MDCPVVRVSTSEAVDAVDRAREKFLNGVPTQFATAVLCGYNGETDWVAVVNTTFAVFSRSPGKRERMQITVLRPIVTEGFGFAAMRKTLFKDVYRGDAFQAAKILMRPGASLDSKLHGHIRSEPNAGSINICLGDVTLDGVKYPDPVVNIRKRDASRVRISDDKELVTDRPHDYGKSRGNLLRVLEEIELLQVQRGNNGRPIRYRAEAGSLWGREWRDIVASLDSMGRVIQCSSTVERKQPYLYVAIPKQVYGGSDGTWCSLPRNDDSAGALAITESQAEALEGVACDVGNSVHIPIGYVAPSKLYQFQLFWDIRHMSDNCRPADRSVLLGMDDYASDTLCYGDLFFKLPAKERTIVEVDQFAWMG